MDKAEPGVIETADFEDGAVFKTSSSATANHE